MFRPSRRERFVLTARQFCDFHKKTHRKPSKRERLEDILITQGVHFRLDSVVADILAIFE
jgi:hypothetical protein